VIKPGKKQTLITAWGRFVLSVFVFAWLNATAQPCLMAMNLPAQADAMSSHVMHGMDQVEQHANEPEVTNKRCAHCPPMGAMNHGSPCAALQAADCDDLPQSTIDARQDKLKLKNVPGLFAIVHAPPVPLVPPLPIAPRQPYEECLAFPAGPSLSILNCVFLI
jgi:hypothetical protein